MAKRKSPSQLAKHKKYDFETPLDPFEGESLKGIAAFIESSVTLQSPAPDLTTTEVDEPASTHEVDGGSQSSAEEPSGILSTLGSRALHPHPSAIVPPETREPQPIRSLNAVPSQPDTHVIGTPNTPIYGVHDTYVPGTLDTDSEGDSSATTANARQGMPRRADARVSSAPSTLVMSTPDTYELGTPNTLLSGIPSMPVTGVPITPDETGIRQRARGAPRPSHESGRVDRAQSDARIPSESSVLNTTHTPLEPTPGSTSRVHESGVSPAIERHPPDDSTLGSYGEMTTAVAASAPPLHEMEWRSTRELSVPNTRLRASGALDNQPPDHRLVVPAAPGSPTEQLLHSGSPTINLRPEPVLSPSASDRGLRPQSVQVILVKIQPATRGQDGLTKGEERIYTFLWRTVFGSKDHNKGEFKVTGETVEISLRRLAQKVGLGLANCAWHIPCLEEKGCITRIRKSDHYHPAVYQVREFAEILQWRRERGLTHFIQRGHLAAFVDPKTGTPMTKFRSQTGTVYRGKVVLGTPSTYQTGVYNTPESSTPDTGQPHLNSSTQRVLDSITPGVINSITEVLRENDPKETNLQITSSTLLSAPSRIVAVLHQLVSPVDDEAAFTLWNECRARVPDCTPEEVAYFVQAKAAVIKGGRIQNPIGFLISAVPKCFEGESFRRFRLEQTRLKEEQRRREEEERQRQQAVEAEINEFRREEEARQKGERLLPTLSDEEQEALYQQARADLAAKGYKATGPTLEKLVHERVIRNLAKRILSEA